MIENIWFFAKKLCLSKNNKKTILTCVLLSAFGLSQINAQGIDDVVTLPGTPPTSINELQHLRTAYVSGATAGGEDVVIDYYVDHVANLLYLVFSSGDGTPTDPHYGMSNPLAYPNLSGVYWSDISDNIFRIQTPDGQRHAAAFQYYDSIDGLQDQSTPKLTIAVGPNHLSTLEFDQLSDNLIGNTHPDTGYAYSYGNGGLTTDYSMPAHIISDMDGDSDIDYDDLRYYIENLSREIGQLYESPSSKVGDPTYNDVLNPENPITTNQIITDYVAHTEKAYVSLMIDHDQDASTPMVETFDRIEIVKESSLGTSNLSSNTKVQVYPNPVAHYLTVKIGNRTLQTEELIGIYNIQGLSVAKGLDVAQLPSGVYFAVIQPKELQDQITVKFIKK